MPDNTELKRTQRRWFSTGFMGGGVVSVEADKHTLHGAVMIRPGEALGHDLWIDREFCQNIVEMANAHGDKGLKARFGHPNMCSEALGTFLGRWKGLAMDAVGRVSGDLFLSSTAAESPKGDLRKYVEEMAAKEPDHFGASVVFTRDEENENAFMLGNQVEGGFRSPDPANTRNLPHARCAELHAADLVDDPAATDGMFSGIGGASLAAQMTEWLDLHPQVLAALNSDPGLVDIVERYADQLKPFLARYTSNMSKVGKCADCGHQQKETNPPCAKCGSQNVTVSEWIETPAAESAQPPPPPTPAESDATLTAELATIKALLDDAKTESERRAGEHAGFVTAAAENVKLLTTDRDGLAIRLQQAEEVHAKLTTERDNLLAKLAAIATGAAPLSATPAPEKKPLTPWELAIKTARI